MIGDADAMNCTEVATIIVANETHLGVHQNDCVLAGTCLDAAVFHSGLVPHEFINEKGANDIAANGTASNTDMHIENVHETGLNPLNVNTLTNPDTSSEPGAFNVSDMILQVGTDNNPSHCAQSSTSASMVMGVGVEVQVLQAGITEVQRLESKEGKGEVKVEARATNVAGEAGGSHARCEFHTRALHGSGALAAPAHVDHVSSGANVKVSTEVKRFELRKAWLQERERRLAARRRDTTQRQGDNVLEITQKARQQYFGQHAAGYGAWGGARARRYHPGYHSVGHGLWGGARARRHQPGHCKHARRH